MEAVIEVLSEAVHEIAADPVKFAIEIVQFGVLVLIVKMVAFGGKKRAGMVRNMLADRRERVEAQIAEAEHGEQWLAEAEGTIASIAAQAEGDAARTIREARRTAREQRLAIEEDARTQAAAIVAEASTALAREQVEMLSSIREQLVEVVTQSTQQLLEQGFTPAEQRAHIQKAIMTGIDELESVSLA